MGTFIEELTLGKGNLRFGNVERDVLLESRRARRRRKRREEGEGRTKLGKRVEIGLCWIRRLRGSHLLPPYGAYSFSFDGRRRREEEQRRTQSPHWRRRL